MQLLGPHPTDKYKATLSKVLTQKLVCYHMPDQKKKPKQISQLHFELKISRQDSPGWLQGCAFQMSHKFFGNRYVSNGARSRD